MKIIAEKRKKNEIHGSIYNEVVASSSFSFVLFVSEKFKKRKNQFKREKFSLKMLTCAINWN
jgi:hypothetical protein